MSAILVKFESPVSINEIDITDNIDNSSEKRVTSSNTSLEEINDTIVNGKSIDKCKSMKNETA